jgi:pimeloyl-ACP methyl ester carboxylesterase
VKLTDTAALNSLRNAMYDTALIPLLPLFISELAAGSGYAEVGQLIVERSTARRFSQGMAFSVNCQEEIAFLPGGFFEHQAAQFPTLAPVILTNRAIDACRIWGLGRADPSIDEPVHSDIPALVLVGQYDPVNPRTSSEQVAAGLSRSTLIEFPGLGHRTVTAHPCPASLIAPFLDDPTAPVDTSCVDEMPAPAWLLS